MAKSTHNWNDKKIDTYEQSIAKKIPSYHLLFELLSTVYSVMIPESKQKEILVVGAGGGQDIVTLATKDGTLRFTGVDPSVEMLKLAESRFQKEQIKNAIELIHGTIEDLSSNKYFDAATCMLVLHFLKEKEDKKALLKCIYQQLKPGTPLFLSVIHSLDNKENTAIFMQAWKNHMLQQGIPVEEWNQFERAIGTEFHLITEDELILLMAECGFIQIVRFFNSLLVSGYVAIKGS
jgi:tRNA (cmo5U34)-methyltransferase